MPEAYSVGSPIKYQFYSFPHTYSHLSAVYLCSHSPKFTQLRHNSVNVDGKLGRETGPNSVQYMLIRLGVSHTPVFDALFNNSSILSFAVDILMIYPML